MKKSVIFVTLSILFHMPVMLLTFQPAKIKIETVTPIEIVSKEKPQIAEAPPKPQPETPRPPPAPPIPTPREPLLVKPPPEPEIIIKDDGENGDDHIPAQLSNKPVIVPKTVSPDNPPPPMTPNEFLNERKNSELFGPDRNIRDIVRDYLGQLQSPPGEDSVSFNNMSVKYDSYFYKFSRALYGVWRYPPDAAKRGESGIVRVTFAINKDGSITDVNMIESSGYPALDREVMRTLRNMPKVELPESYELNVLHVNGYFIYSLTGEYRLY